MSKLNRRRGFTIVELVIVIAVVAILAAVLIPTFASIVKKANTAADIQLVRNLNMIVAVDGADSCHAALIAAEENGYKVEKITPTTDERSIVWDGTNLRFALLDEEGNEIFPAERPKTANSNLFILSDTYPAEGFDGYAVYLTDGYTGGAELTVTTGVDAGNNEIAQIIYTGTEEVAIRGWEHTTIQVKSGTVHHYDVADAAYVADGATYIEHGSLNANRYEGSYDATAGFAGGQGTEESPYLIATAEQLQNQMFADSTKSHYYTLVADIDLSDAESMNSYGSDALVGEFLYNSTFDGNGHTLTVAGASKSLFTYVTNSTIKNLTLNFDDCSGYSVLSMYLNGTVVENVTTTGTISGMSGGCGPLTYGAYNSCKIIGCVNDANITGTGKTSAFVGANSGDIYFENCVNNGIIKCGQSAMFLASGTAGNMTIKNCENNGVINYMDYGTGSSGKLVRSYYVAINCQELTSIEVDGTEIPNEAANKYDLENEYFEPVPGSGICIFGSEGVEIVQNDDKTFTLVSTNGAVASFKVQMKIYLHSVDPEDNGGGYYYINETVEVNGVGSYKTELKYLAFVNSNDALYTEVEMLGDDAKVVKDAEGNLYYGVDPIESNGQTYQLLRDGLYSGSVSVSAYDSEGNLITTSTLNLQNG